MNIPSAPPADCPKPLSHYFGAVWKLSWPTLIYAFLEAGMGLVDVYYASYLGTEGVAAIGFSRQLFLVLQVGTISITTGTLTLISQHYGGKRYDAVASAAFHSFILALTIGIGLGIVGVLMAAPGLRLLGAKEAVLAGGTGYLRVLLGGIVFMLLNYAASAIFRAMGDAITPLKISSAILLLNAVISYYFAFGAGNWPGMGLPGIALGTITARGLGAAISISILSAKGREIHLTPRIPLQVNILSQLLRIGLPAGLSGLLRNGARIIFFAMVASTVAGTAAAAAATVGFQLRMMAIMPALAFQASCAALVGQSIGGGDIPGAVRLSWTTIFYCLCLGIGISICTYAFSGQVMAIMTDSHTVTAIGVLTLSAIAFEQLCTSISIVASGALAGAGDTKPPLFYTAACQWLLLLPLTYILASESMYDVQGAWVAWCIVATLQMVLTLARFARGQWKTINIHA